LQILTNRLSSTDFDSILLRFAPMPRKLDKEVGYGRMLV